MNYWRRSFALVLKGEQAGSGEGQEVSAEQLERRRARTGHGSARAVLVPAAQGRTPVRWRGQGGDDLRAAVRPHLPQTAGLPRQARCPPQEVGRLDQVQGQPEDQNLARTPQIGGT